MSCAGCHIPSAAFVDHRQHDVGSGGLFKTPTLRNADFSAPYFHDGRYDTYEQVVEHFDHAFDLGLSAQDKDDLVAYLTVVGNGVLPYEREGAGAKLKEINDFSTVLDVAIDAGDKETVSLAVETIGGELRELTEQYPDRKDTSLSGGERQRALARRVLKEMVLSLRRIDLAMADGRASDAASENKTYRTLRAAIPPVLTQASPLVAVQQIGARVALHGAPSDHSVEAHGALIAKLNETPLNGDHSGSLQITESIVVGGERLASKNSESFA